MSIMNWKEDYAKKCITAQQAAATIQSGDKIILLPVNSMPIDILNALAARKDELHKVKIASNLMTYPFAFVNGDYAGHITYYSGYFGPLERMFHAQGNVVPYPMHLSKSSIALDRSGYSDVALLEVTPPDSRGYMNLGPCGAVYGRYAIDKCKKVIVQVNTKTPWIHGIDNLVHVDEVDYIVEADHDLVPVPEITITDVEKKIGENIAAHIPDGATIQLGIGGIPNAVAYFLHNKKDLGVHAEIISDSVAELAELGVITGRKKTLYPGKIVVGGLVIGTKRLLDFVDNNPTIMTMPIAIANHFDVIKQNDNMCSINAGLTVDLTGQVASETIGHTPYSATGGQLDFVRGAAASKGGKSFIALKSTSTKKDGTLTSRIVLNIKGPAKLEGTVHVNVQLIRKFIKRYFFSPKEYAPIGPVFDLADDLFLFNQGTASGLGQVQFNDYRPVFDEFKALPNVAVFITQMDLFREMLEKAFPNKVQEMDPSFSLTVGEMFSIVVYGQLILEQAKIDNLDKDIINQIFDFMVRDFSSFGLQIYAKATTNDVQRGYFKEIMLMMPVSDPAQYDRIWQDCVISLNGEYEMTDKKS